MNIDFKHTISFLMKHDCFTILCHVNPDGDTLGSGYALCGALHLMGKYARVICDDEPSERFEFLKDAVNPDLTRFPKNAAETVVAVDIADRQLFGGLREKYPDIQLCIDHHISNSGYAVYTLLDPKAAACAEVVWELIMEMEDVVGIPLANAEIAAAIYTGISTDTGCFKYANTTTFSHIFAAEAMGYGFDVANINYIMFEMKTKERVLLEQRTISNLEYHFGHKCALVVLDADMLEGVDPEDASNVSAIPKQIQGVEVGVVIKSKLDTEEETWKISVRTGGNINAQTICSKLGGGGHIRAAGCLMTGGIDMVKAKVLAEIEKQM